MHGRRMHGEGAFSQFLSSPQRVLGHIALLQPKVHAGA